MDNISGNSVITSEYPAQVAIVDLIRSSMPIIHPFISLPSLSPLKIQSAGDHPTAQLLNAF